MKDMERLKWNINEGKLGFNFFMVIFNVGRE